MASYLWDTTLAVAAIGCRVKREDVVGTYMKNCGGVKEMLYLKADGTFEQNISYIDG
jgi:hypothetical protein